MADLQDLVLYLLGSLAAYQIQLLFPALMLLCRSSLKRPKWLLALLLVPYCCIPFVVGLFDNGMFWIEPIFQIGGWYYSSFLIFFLYLMLVLWFCFSIDLKRVALVCISAHTIQSLIFHLTSALRILILRESGLPYTMAYYVLYAIVTVAVLSLFWFIYLRKADLDHDMRAENGEMFVFCVVAFVMLDVINSWASSCGLINLHSYCLSTVLCAMFLVVQFSLFQTKRLEIDNMVMQELLRKGEKQFQFSQETIDMINMKCHDLKHQLEMIEQISPEHMKGYLEDSKKLTQIYDRSVNTGNYALDNIIFEKGLLCERYQINLNCMIEGAQLDFMAISDIYSLFCNILDNAIESVRKEEPENRLISMRSVRKSGCNTMVIENYCSHQVSFQNGLPVTTQADTTYHGYGMKSIRYIVEKYGGSLVVDQDQNCFALKMIFII